MKQFKVHYQVTCHEGENIDQKLEWITLEQSVELPKDVVSGHIFVKVTGTVTNVEKVADNVFKAEISWPVANAGNDPTQFLNILYGNISLKKGIKITSVDWSTLAGIFSGPMFGIEGIRNEFGIFGRPLSCGVLKPMGLSANELADLARQFAMGGIDLIKDDHGLANQHYAPFEERVLKVSEVLQKTMMDTGIATRYFPNITTSGSKLLRNYEDAADLGADGVLVIPHLCGMEAMLELAQNEIDLPIIAHPAYSGTLVTQSDHGFTPAFLYGELYRAFGADFTVYPNAGGRFSFSVDECLDLNDSARSQRSPFKPIFPMPGGGMKRETIPHWIQEYGNDTVFLFGASLFEHKDGIQKAVQEVQSALKSSE